MTNDKNDVSAAAELVVTDDRRVGNVSTVLADCPCEVYRNAIGAMTKRCPEAKERLLSCHQIRRFVEDLSVEHEMGSLSVIDVTGEGMGGR